MVTSRSKGMARNFSCGNFIVVCGGYWYASSGLSVGETGAVYNFVPDYCDEFSPSQCSGGSSTGSGSGEFNWSVGSAGIVKLSSSSQQNVTSWPQLYGVGSGGGYGDVEVSAGSCQANGSGPVPVAPTITSISPSTIPINGNVTQITISGSGFGSSPAINLATGVTLTGSNPSDTQIVANLAAENGATVGNSSITVTANGLTSNAVAVILDGPFTMNVLSDTWGLCTGCTATIYRSIKYQVKRFSGSNAGAATFCEAPVLTGGQACSPAATPITNTCSGNPVNSLDGTFTDSWGFGSDNFSPVGCGPNVTDPWFWAYTTKMTPIGTPAGFLHTNIIEIDNVKTPNGLQAGTQVPK